jgi:hypothetical protein
VEKLDGCRQQISDGDLSFGAVVHFVDDGSGKRSSLRGNEILEVTCIPDGDRVTVDALDLERAYESIRRIGRVRHQRNCERVL